MRKSTSTKPTGNNNEDAIPVVFPEPEIDIGGDVEWSNTGGPVRRRGPVSSDISKSNGSTKDSPKKLSLTGKLCRFLSTTYRNSRNMNWSQRLELTKATMEKEKNTSTTKTTKLHTLSRRRMFCFGLALFMATTVLSLLSGSRNTDTEGALDFVTAGFLKCGTSTLLFAFAAHPEIHHHQHEMCLVNRLPSFLGDWGLRHNVHKLQLMEQPQSTSSTSAKKMGLKCPSAIMNEKAIQRIHKHSPNAKFVVTLRNPILMVESMYNYIVIVAHRFKVPFLLPSFQAMVNSGWVFDLITFPATFLPIGGGILHLAKYEEYLGNFQRTILQNNNNNAKTKDITPKLFLLTLDQLKDDNEIRNAAFRKELQEYLGLSQPIRSMVTPENKNWFRGERAFPETIDICDDANNPLFGQIRRTLLERAFATVEWIENTFLTDPGVQVSNQEFFIQGLRTWTIDPCKDGKRIMES